jgi:hypothetical protein
MNVDDLFQCREPWQCNAMLRDGDLMFDESYYVDGFLDASLVLMSKVINDALDENDNIPTVCPYPLIQIDDLIYPIMFNLRHGLEIWVKWKINQSVRLGRLNKPGSGHSIMKNYHLLQSAFDDIGEMSDKLKGMAYFFAAIDSVDKNGQVFRYEKDNKGKPHLDGKKTINIYSLHGKTVLFKRHLKEVDAIFLRG